MNTKKLIKRAAGTLGSITVAMLLTGCGDIVNKTDELGFDVSANDINFKKKHGLYPEAGYKNAATLRREIAKDKLNVKIAEAAQLYAVAHPEFVDFVRQTEKLSVTQITDPASGKVIGIKFSEAPMAESDAPHNAANIMGR